ncbi:MFS transporter [Kitasatospora viridis]|uniref:Transmembrane secretion effector n=1 Tax=Kitasatospora viridis TaxID=281105 RepID=A0A561TUZ8_9ACTN|nr:MFS transporter [Kitasatospora viridis]TWF90939.1 transmembrane secretion effector [Kitasatospora viridis]
MEERAGLAADGPAPEAGAGSERGSLRRDLAGPLRGLLVGQCLGQCGDGLAQIGFAQFVLFDVGRGASPGRIAAVLAVTLLPFSVVGPFAGVLLDRLDRRRTLVLVSVLRGLLVAVGAVVVAERWTAPAYLAVVLLLSSSRLVLTAKGAALPRTVPRARLVPANAFSALTGSAAAFLGALGGSLFVGRSVVAAFLGAGVLYAGAAAVFALLPGLGPELTVPRGSALPAVRRTVADLVEGVRLAARTAAIRRPLLAVGAHRLLLGAGFVVLVLVADSQYRLRASGYAVALAATGIATFAASAVAPPLAGRYGARALVPAAFLPAAAAAYVGGLFPSLWVLVLCLAVAAFAFQVLKVCADALVGGATPDAARGRVFALYDLLYNLAFVLSALVLVPWWQAGRERTLLWWVAAGFTAGWVVFGSVGRPTRDGGGRWWRRGPRRRHRPHLRGPHPHLRGRATALVAGALPALAFPAPAWWWLAPAFTVLAAACQATLRRAPADSDGTGNT